jgi:hypothetical protein
MDGHSLESHSMSSFEMDSSLRTWLKCTVSSRLGSVLIASTAG